MPHAPERIATLSSYAPQTVLRWLASAGAAPEEPVSERFPAALLLIDIAGFTPLTAAAVRRGPAGTEALSRALNSYLGQIIDLVADHGGDITKIVGDAILPIWPAVDEDVASAARRAAACGLAITAELGEVEMEGDLRLSLKVGLCAGEVVVSHVGGLDGRWHFLIAGDGVSQLSAAEAAMRNGEVVASPQAWELVSSRFVGQVLAAGHVLLRPTQQASERRALAAVTLAPGQEAAVRAYVPEVCLARLDAGQADWLAELRRTTVAFVSVLGVADASPSAVTVLHRVTQAAQRALARYDGWLKEITMDDKGTTLVAAFGVPPYTHEDDAARAVEAALAIRSEIGELGLTAGIGVATGQAFCGPVGNARRRDFVVLGQHVNLASRLMQAASDGGLLCDAETHAAARSRHAFDRLPAYLLKGVSTPTDIYRARSGSTVADTVAEASRRLVDRTAELARITAAIEALQGGTGGLVMLEGEPGIGKSRLVGEAVRRAQAAGIATLTGGAAEIEGSTPYHAWRGVFERLLGVEGIADRTARRSLVLDRLRSDRDSLRLAPLLNPILSLDLPDDEVTSQMTGAVRADNTRDLLVALLRARTAHGALMVVLEDAHWLDTASWALLMRARTEIPSLLLVVTRRPIGDAAADPVATIREGAATLRLSPLSRDDVVALACERTGATRLAEPVAALVHGRAEGNPLFIEQLTYAMRDAGRIVVQDGVLRAAPGAGDLESSIIPDTVQRVITARLDQLPPGEAMTLKVASVIGQRFALRTLTDIYPLPIERDALIEHLDTLTRLDLVTPAPGAPEPTYDFRHVITQEVAYNLMLSAQSQQLHRSLAEWYERTYAADLSPFHAFLAHHWRKAGAAPRAVDHLDSAGGQALRTFANEEAIGFIEQAIQLCAEAGLAVDQPRRARWDLQLGEAYVHMSRYREGRDHLESGLRLLESPAPATRWQQATWLVGEIGRQAFRRIGLIRGVRRLTDADREDLVAICRAYERLAEAAYYGGESLLPLYCVLRILNEAEASGSPPEIARGFAGTGALFGVVPLPRVAEWYLERALARLEAVDDLTTREVVGIVVGFYYVGAAKWEQAREQFRTVRRTARRLGDRRRFEDAVGNLMELEYLQGAFGRARELAEELTAAASLRNDQRFRAEGLAGAAYCAWQLGDEEAALRSLDALKSIVTSESDLTDEVRIKANGLLALIHLGRGDPSQALAAAEQAMRLTAARPTYFGTLFGFVGPAEVYLSRWESGQSGHEARTQAGEAVARLRRYAGVFPVGRPRYATLRGRYLWRLGRRRDALRAMRRALASATELSMPYEEGLIHYELGRHLEAGDPARDAHLAAARDIFSRLDAVQDLARLERAAGAPAAG